MKPWWIIGFLLTLPLRAETLVLPVEAITDSGRLSAAAFAERHPGIALVGTVPEAEGYYVRYRHENLTYLFGPVAERAAAERWRLDLEVIRDQAVAAPPAQRYSVVDLFEFRFDNATANGPAGQGASAADGGASADRAGAGAASGSTPADGSGAAGNASRPAPGPGATPADRAGQPAPGTPGGSPGTPGSPTPADGSPGTPGQGQAQPNIWTVLRRIFGF